MKATLKYVLLVLGALVVVIVGGVIGVVLILVGF